MIIESYNQSEESRSFSPNNQARMALNSLGLSGFGMVSHGTRNRGTQTFKSKFDWLNIMNMTAYENIKIFAISFCILAISVQQARFFDRRLTEIETSLSSNQNQTFDEIKVIFKEKLEKQDEILFKIREEMIVLKKFEELKFEISNRTSTEIKFKLSDTYDKFVKLEHQIADLKMEIQSIRGNTCSIQFKP